MIQFLTRNTKKQKAKGMKKALSMANYFTTNKRKES